MYNEAYSDTCYVMMNNVFAVGSGITDGYGVYNVGDGGTCDVMINNSQIWGDTNSIYNDACTTGVGASLLGWEAVDVSDGTVTCYACYDEDHTNAGGVSACP